MIKKKNILYALSAILGTSTLVAGVAAAGNPHDDYWYSTQPIEKVALVNAEEPVAVVNDYEKQKGVRVIYDDQPVVQASVSDGVPPKDRDGSLFPGGSCKSCAKDKDGSLFGGAPCEGCSKENSMVPGPCSQCEARQAEVIALRNYIPYTPVVYEAVQKNCCQMGTIALDHVDFRIKNKGIDGPYSSKLGNYRFRIFGCRRFDKEASLNSGRIMEKNIDFQTVFEEAVDDCYKVLPMPKDLCLQTTPAETPEYVLTAEITDYFMNICDEYDWNKSEKKETRTGTSEITIVWRLMDLTKSKVYWKGESSGYGELYYGEKNGEVKLIERAFADASSNLRGITGFEDQLLQRKSMQEMAAERYALIEEERAINPLKCGYHKQYECVKSCELGRPGAMINQCCDCAPVVDSCITEAGELSESCQVVDDTWVDTGDVASLEELCIVATDPCKALTPETMYRMRSSVVEITGANGRKGAGLLISENFILTSGDLIDSNNSNYTVKTIRGAQMNARAVRVNPSKNTALLMLEQPTEYTPLALNLSLPEVGADGFLTMGVLDVQDFKEGQDYLENSARIEGYRYTKEKGAEILANTFIQNVTVGGALFHKTCTVSGMAHSGIKTDDGLDVYVPTEIALRSLGISICGHEYVEESPWQQTVYKPVTEQIETVQQAPEAMKVKDRK